MVNIDKVKKRSLQKHFEKKYGSDNADIILDCMKDGINQGLSGKPLEDFINQCLVNKQFSQQDADDASVTAYSFIAVG